MGAAQQLERVANPSPSPVLKRCRLGPCAALSAAATAAAAAGSSRAGTAGAAGWAATVAARGAGLHQPTGSTAPAGGAATAGAGAGAGAPPLYSRQRSQQQRGRHWAQTGCCCTGLSRRTCCRPHGQQQYCCRSTICGRGWDWRWRRRFWPRQRAQQPAAHHSHPAAVSGPGRWRSTCRLCFSLHQSACTGERGL